MHVELWAKPGFDAFRIEAIAVDVERASASLLRLSYVVRGDLDQLVLPPPAPPFRTSNLWKATCFEAFLKAAGRESYREFNFSPSGQWAAYDFTGYRTGMAEAWVPAAPDITLVRHEDRLELNIALSIDLPDEPYRLGLAAITEERELPISYWAASHPSGGDPDFHHDAGFVLKLPPAPQSSPRT
jgi:hypothetical protein